MGHNINFNELTGKYSFFSVQQKAWHGLGQIVSDYPTSAEAIQYAGLDYNIAKEPNIPITCPAVKASNRKVASLPTVPITKQYWAQVWAKTTISYKTVKPSLSLML